jgi:hypothetical protein
MINDGPEAAMHNELQYTVYQVFILLNFPYCLDTPGPCLMQIHLVQCLKKKLWFVQIFLKTDDRRTIENKTEDAKYVSF